MDGNWSNIFRNAMQGAYSECQKNVMERAQIGAERAKGRFVDHTVETYKEYAKNAVDNFYNSYAPSLYKFQRRGSLYNVPRIYGSENGFVISFNEGAITYRDGSPSSDSDGSLFDLVFIQGWHGGADHGPGHPDNKNPYWRTPHPTYKHWYATQAEQAPESPYDEISRKTDDYINKEAQGWWASFVDECVNEALREG